MCAIIGVLGKRLPRKEQFKKARDTMTHRGPDDCGLYYVPEEGIALGHRRLSIIDLSEAGRQPMLSHDGRYVLVYNGEIYNYVELREELKKTYDFRTQTDTEVLLAAYIRWGEKSLQKLNGMFSFAVWDRKKKELFAARDRLGIKPFFYTEIGETLSFSSEIKGLLALGHKAEPNERTIYEYLYHGLYDHGPDTFFRGIYMLPAGSYFTRKNGKIVIKKYWDLAKKGEGEKEIKEEDARERFRELVTDAVRLRFRSDVPVGLSLSSGLDSNILLFCSEDVSEKVGTELNLLSRCFRSKEFNECALLNEYLTDAQKRRWHKSYFASKDALPLANRVNQVEDQPYGGFPTIGGYYLHEGTKEKYVPVILEGQGLDEILAGYKYYVLEHERDIREENAVDTSTLPPSLSVSQDTSPLVHRDIVHNDFVRVHYSANPVFKTPFQSNLLNAQYRDIVYTKLPRVLRFNDHVSMSHSRELRVPYLDYRIVEFCFFLPARYKIRGGERKVLARDAFGELLPSSVRNKDKKTFGAVQTEWLRRYYKKEVFSLLNSPSFRSRKYWNHAKLMEKVERFYNGEGANSFFIWQCINLELWFREFID